MAMSAERVAKYNLKHALRLLRDMSKKLSWRMASTDLKKWTQYADLGESATDDPAAIHYMTTCQIALKREDDRGRQLRIHMR